MATRRGISCGPAVSALGGGLPGAWARRRVAAPPYSKRPTTRRLTAERLVANMVPKFEPLAWAHGPRTSARSRAGRLGRRCGGAPNPARILAWILWRRQPALAPR